MRVNLATAYPNETLLSGPAAGIAFATTLGRERGYENLITFDMGGTSTDMCVIRDGRATMVASGTIAGQEIGTPMIEIRTIGAGGGAIASLGDDGLMKVGPRSAGARPGPACYGLGGELPTLTDANVVLGYISAETFLGGRMKLSRERAVKAIEQHIAIPLGLSVEDASFAINAVGNARIAEGIRAATVRCGRDPRDCALFSFGGAGGVHADMVGRELLIPKTIIPREARRTIRGGRTGIESARPRRRWTSCASSWACGFCIPNCRATHRSAVRRGSIC